MEKMSSRDKVLVAILIAVGLVYVIWTYVITPINTSVAATKEETANVLAQIQDKTSLQAEIDRLTTTEKKLDAQLSSDDKKNNLTINKQEFVMFLTGKCKDNNIEIVRLDDLGTKSQENGTWKSRYDFELRGTHSDLLRICDEIDSLGVDYNVTSMSLRQNLTLPWTTRQSDGSTKLPWFIDSQKSSEQQEAQDKAQQEAVDKAAEKYANDLQQYVADSISDIDTGYTVPDDTYVDETPAQDNSQSDSSSAVQAPEEDAVDSVTNNVSIGDRLNSLLGIGKKEEPKQEAPKQSATAKPKATQTPKKTQTTQPKQTTTPKVPEAPKAEQIVVPEVTVDKYYDGTLRMSITIEFIMQSDPSLSKYSMLADNNAKGNNGDTTDTGEQGNTAEQE